MGELQKFDLLLTILAESVWFCVPDMYWGFLVYEEDLTVYWMTVMREQVMNTKQSLKTRNRL